MSCDFLGYQRLDFEFAPAENRRSAEQAIGALPGGDMAPGFKCLVGGFNGLHAHFDGGDLKDADDLAGMRGVERRPFLGGGDLLSGNVERIFAAELGADFAEGVFHGSAVLGLGEIHERLVSELRGSWFAFSGHHCGASFAIERHCTLACWRRQRRYRRMVTQRTPSPLPPPMYV